MDIIKTYFKNFGWILIASILYVVATFVATEIINVNTETMLSIRTRLIDTVLITIINIIIIKKVAGRTDKKLYLKTYLKAVAVTIITSLITWIVAFAMVQLKTVIESIVIWAILVILAYCLKVILSFAIYIIVLDEESGIIDSIIESIKITTRKNNIVKIALYNSIFLIVLLVANIFGIIGEIITYFVFVGNEILYLKLTTVDDNDLIL